MTQSPFRIGTSGWSYDHWRETFYPAGLAKQRWFDYYAARFDTVEVNATFYRRFRDETYHRWRERAPAGFRYVLKVPRLISHRKHLHDCAGEIAAFCRSAALLGETLGLLLLQLPPSMPYDPPRLRAALAAFGNPGRVAVEFRNPRWLTDETRALLCESGAVFCCADSPDQPLGDWLTADQGYIRLHGRQRWYDYDYPHRELEQIGQAARRMVAQGARRVYLFFNNDAAGYAPHNAQQLRTMLQ